MSKRRRQGLAWYSSQGRNNLEFWLNIFLQIRSSNWTGKDWRSLKLSFIINSVIHHIRRKL